MEEGKKSGERGALRDWLPTGYGVCLEKKGKVGAMRNIKD